jgi:ubiquinone/menaquinone biosynthesis C-methylase UbiE
MKSNEAHLQWEMAAPGWAKWEDEISKSVQPATDAMLEMADVVESKRVLDLASGAGNQTLIAARIVGQTGHVVANDISKTMLDHVEQNASSVGLTNISTLLGAVQELDLPANSFDAVICRFALMLFAEPEKVLSIILQALRPGGKIAVVVFSTPQANPLFVKPMQILLKHAGKTPPPGAPGLFSLGAPGVLEQLFERCGFANIENRRLELIFQMTSSAQMLEMMQEAFGAYRVVIGDSPKSVQIAAWEEILAFFRSIETDNETDNGIRVPGEVLVGSAQKS